MDRHTVDAYMDQFITDMEEYYSDDDFQDWVIEHESKLEPVVAVSEEELNEFGDNIPF